MVKTQQTNTTTVAGITLPIREGDAPATVGPVPHRQESERASETLQRKLIASINALDGIRIAKRGGYIGRAFIGQGAADWHAHIHHYEDGAHQDGSMHIAMPQSVSADIEAAGWGERHPAYPVMLLVYSPRNEAEVTVITDLVKLSYDLSRSG